MTAVFDAALAFVLEHEGGARITNDPRDPGGLTKFGISKRAYPHLDIAALTEADAKAIYRRDYWDRGACDALPAAVAVLHFDACVNQGLAGAARLLQTAAGVTADGAIGPKTLAAVQRARPVDLAAEYAARRMTHYARLPHFDRFGLGWSRRLMACLSLALGLAGAAPRGSVHPTTVV